jgi:3'-phosphoadenosine 5'-phosphosulfate sulfotransferase (PAPS reductase)/FAD synthetase
VRKAEFAPGDRRATIGLLTGTRRRESARRARTQAAAFRKVKSQVWINPLIDWTGERMRAYRLAHRLPESDVAALLHRSGECNCGAFAASGERDQLASLWPVWFNHTIGELEHQARLRRIPACRWGERPLEAPAPAGPMCSDCQLRLEGPAA